jgi:rhodanese-related sulfurtransferase
MKNTYKSFLHAGSRLIALCLAVGIFFISFSSVTAQIGQSSPTDVVSIEYKNISVATFDALRKDHAYIKVDVRTPDEIALNQLGGSLELDYDSASFVSELEKLDKDKHYLVFSTDGIKSARAAQKMVDLGFANVSNLQGGFNLWMATDRPPE